MICSPPLSSISSVYTVLLSCRVTYLWENSILNIATILPSLSAFEHGDPSPFFKLALYKCNIIIIIIIIIIIMIIIIIIIIIIILILLSLL